MSALIGQCQPVRQRSDDVERREVFYFVGGILAAGFPDYTLEVFGVTNAFVGTVMVLALRAPPTEVDGAP